MTITKDKVVLIEYTLKDKRGNVLDSSVGKEPLPYVHGYGSLISGLETALEGKESGNSFELTVEPKDGYGDYRDDLVLEASIEEFKELEKVEVGVQFEVELGLEEGKNQVVVAEIIKVEDTKVTYDLNHPLAGETLHYEINVKDIRDATSEELTQIKEQLQLQDTN